jgi:hypothetical protein
MMEVRARSRAGGASHLFFTYDPQDARNGNLYLTKCGGRGIYVFYNLYGLKTEASSRSRLSHRLLVRWDLDAGAVPPESGIIAGRPQLSLWARPGSGRPFALEFLLFFRRQQKAMDKQRPFSGSLGVYQRHGMKRHTWHEARERDSPWYWSPVRRRSNILDRRIKVHMEELKGLLDRLKKNSSTRRLTEKYDLPWALQVTAPCKVWRKDQLAWGDRGSDQAQGQGPGAGSEESRDRGRDKGEGRGKRQRQRSGNGKGRKRTDEGKAKGRKRQRKGKAKGRIGVKKEAVEIDTISLHLTSTSCLALFNFTITGLLPFRYSAYLRRAQVSPSWRQ